MSAEAIEKIQEIQKIRESLPLVFIAALVTGSLAWLLCRARKSPLAPAPREPREPPLWSSREVGWIFVAWLFAPLFLWIPLSASGIDVKGYVGEILIPTACHLLVCGFALHLLLGRLGQPPATLGLAPVPVRHIAGTALLFFLTYLPFVLVTGVWMLFLHDGLGLEIKPQDVVNVIEEKLKESDRAYVAAAAVAAVVVAPVIEEVLFRGLLFGWLRARMGTTAAAVISSVIFAALHLSLTAFASLTFLALVFCALYVRTGSIIPGMLFHAMLNGQTILVLVLSAGDESS